MLAFADASARRALDSAIDRAIATDQLSTLIKRIRTLDELGTPVVLHSDANALGFVVFAPSARNHVPILAGTLAEFRARAASSAA